MMNTADPQSSQQPLHAAMSFFLDGYEIRVVPCGETALWLYRGLGELTSFRDLGVVRWSIVHPASLTVSMALQDWAPPGSARAQHLLSAALRIHHTHHHGQDHTSQWWPAYDTSPRTQPESVLMTHATEEIPIVLAASTASHTTGQADQS